MIVWSIEQSGTDTFSATYEVDQQIKEGEQTSNVKATYTVKVHVDADGDNEQGLRHTVYVLQLNKVECGYFKCY